MAASDYVPIFFKNRLHLAGRPQMSTRLEDWTIINELLIAWLVLQPPSPRVLGATRAAAQAA